MEYKGGDRCQRQCRVRISLGQNTRVEEKEGIKGTIKIEPQKNCITINKMRVK